MNDVLIVCLARGLRANDFGLLDSWAKVWSLQSYLFLNCYVLNLIRKLLKCSQDKTDCKLFKFSWHGKNPNGKRINFQKCLRSEYMQQTKVIKYSWKESFRCCQDVWDFHMLHWRTFFIRNSKLFFSFFWCCVLIIKML